MTKTASRRQTTPARPKDRKRRPRHRASWCGQLRFGLVSFGVQAFNAHGRIEGQEVVTPEAEQPPEVINLMDALKKSLAARESPIGEGVTLSSEAVGPPGIVAQTLRKTGEPPRHQDTKKKGETARRLIVPDDWHVKGPLSVR